MNVLFNLVVIVQVISALAIIGLVLLQHGKGADMGAAFGSGASGSLFGASGSSNFLSKSTALAAAIFFASTLGLASMANNRTGAAPSGGVMERMAQPGNGVPAPGGANVPATTAPATTAPSPTAGVPVAPASEVPAAPAQSAPAPAAPAAPATQQ
ncbi:preprotein translocase subunit SecG [Massilia sp. Dwa41.01b]|uniref:preprotein translocase subunit SecG n=1 Tax=unclassified Massilia TaxID=2609279 RepID=UPI0015FF922B|nr:MULTISPECIES: preprotein translocase subunit SecG [unclassified Massilia]QNA89710.1 preprotein translocase subunit SecG [Massilia sp. Dwa41.01b]QNB00606.1 preprotein translocase subunit SecG [Massilia sp. Se16.2.3]